MNLSQISSAAGFGTLALLSLWCVWWFISGACREYGRKAFRARQPFNKEWDRYAQEGWLAEAHSFQRRRLRERGR